MDHQGGALGQGHHYENLVLKKLLTSWQLVKSKLIICVQDVVESSQRIARRAGRIGFTLDLEEMERVPLYSD